MSQTYLQKTIADIIKATGPIYGDYDEAAADITATIWQAMRDPTPEMFEAGAKGIQMATKCDWDDAMIAASSAWGRMMDVCPLMPKVTP